MIVKGELFGWKTDKRVQGERRDEYDKSALHTKKKGKELRKSNIERVS
jgi:hypothetical protein